MVRKLFALVLLLFATPALATSYVGTIAGADYLYLPIPFGPGTYQLSFAFSEPVPFDVTIHTEEHYTSYDPYTGDYGGNDEYYGYSYFYGSQTRSGSVRWTIAPPYTYNFGGMITHGSFNGTYADFNFTGDPDRTITYYLGITAVPEPSQWVLLICGFGLAGAAMRRRNRGEARAAMIGRAAAHRAEEDGGRWPRTRSSLGRPACPSRLRGRLAQRPRGTTCDLESPKAGGGRHQRRARYSDGRTPIKTSK